MTFDLDKQHEKFILQLIGDGCLRSEPVTRAFRKIKRHDFLPERLKDQAYRDHAIAIKFRSEHYQTECSSSCSQPSLTAMMMEWLDIKPGISILDIGTGSGYTSALLCIASGQDQSVYSMDIDNDLIKDATQRLLKYGLKPHLAAGDALQSIPFGVHFDRILVTAGVPYVPQCWIDSLRPGAVMVMPFYWGGIDYLMTLRQTESWRLTGQCRIFTVFTGLTRTRDPQRVLETTCGKGSVVLYDFLGIDGNTEPKTIVHESDYKELNFELNFSTPESLLGFHLYTLAVQPFFHGGLQLAHSGSGGCGFHGYAFYAFDPVRTSLILIPFEPSRTGLLGMGDAETLVEELNKRYDEWKQLGKPEITDFSIRFVFNCPDYKITHPEGWHIMKEKNSLHIILNIKQKD